MGLSSFIICLYVSLEIKYFIYSILLKKLSNSELFISSNCQYHHTKDLITFQIIIYQKNHKQTISNIFIVLLITRFSLWIDTWLSYFIETFCTHSFIAWFFQSISLKTTHNLMIIALLHSSSFLFTTTSGIYLSYAAI